MAESPTRHSSAAKWSWNRLRQFHEDPVVIAWWCRALGPVLQWLTPERRRVLLAVGAVIAGIKEVRNEIRHAGHLSVPSDIIGFIVVVLALLAILWLCYRAAVTGFARLPSFVQRHPQITLHSAFWCLLAVLWVTSPESGPWRAVLMGVALTFPLLIWRCGYLLLSGQRGRAEGTSFLHHQIYLWGTQTPYGKGLDYLSRYEAKSEEELAHSQLAGIKLLILVLLWQGAMELMRGVVYAEPGNAVTAAFGEHTLGIPRLRTIVGSEGAVPVWLSWASVYSELFWQVLRRAAGGHAIIAVFRLFGFNIFRNTYKPLLAESVLEFWNRYFYYFKEVLNEFFFLPTFTRYFQKWPYIRLCAAVFAAALVGNMYFHILKASNLLVVADFATLWASYNSRIFYCFLLALGIFVSMLRIQRRAGQPPSPLPTRRLLRIAGVWTFFALIYIWDVRPGTPFLARMDFFAHLFGF